MLERYTRLAQLVTGRTNVHIEDGVLWVQMMLDKLELPKLSDFGVCATSFERVAEDALRSVAIKGNPLPLTMVRLVYILDQVCGCSGHCDEEHEHQAGSVEIVSNSIEEKLT